MKILIYKKIKYFEYNKIPLYNKKPKLIINNILKNKKKIYIHIYTYNKYIIKND